MAEGGAVAKSQLYEAFAASGKALSSGKRLELLDVLTQGDFGEGDKAELAKRYPGAQSRDFDGNPGRLTEMDALVAYLQMLGTQVDFKKAAAREQAR